MATLSACDFQCKCKNCLTKVPDKSNNSNSVTLFLDETTSFNAFVGEVREQMYYTDSLRDTDRRAILTINLNFDSNYFKLTSLTSNFPSSNIIIEKSGTLLTIIYYYKSGKNDNSFYISNDIPHNVLDCKINYEDLNDNLILTFFNIQETSSILKKYSDLIQNLDKNNNEYDSNLWELMYKQKKELDAYIKFVLWKL